VLDAGYTATAVWMPPTIWGMYQLLFKFCWCCTGIYHRTKTSASLWEKVLTISLHKHLRMGWMNVLKTELVVNWTLHLIFCSKIDWIMSSSTEDSSDELSDESAWGMAEVWCCVSLPVVLLLTLPSDCKAFAVEFLIHRLFRRCNMDHDNVLSSGTHRRNPD
jgi:hypothetical protein